MSALHWSFSISFVASLNGSDRFREKMQELSFSLGLQSNWKKERDNIFGKCSKAVASSNLFLFGFFNHVCPEDDLARIIFLFLRLRWGQFIMSGSFTFFLSWCLLEKNISKVILIKLIQLRQVLKPSWSYSGLRRWLPGLKTSPSILDLRSRFDGHSWKPINKSLPDDGKKPPPT